MPKTSLRISVYEFDDYQAFLQSAYEDLHEQNPSISYRYLQKKAGYSSSSNHFWQKATGHSPMGQQAAQRYARVLGLSAKQTQYFTTLAAMNQAKNDEDRNFYLEQLQQFPRFRKTRTNGRLRFEYYTQWYLPALRALVTLADFREEPEWVSKHVSPRITPKQAKAGIAKLLELGFLVRNAKDELQQAEPFIGDYSDREEPDEISKLALRNYHRKMIELGGMCIDGQPQDRRYVIGNTLAVSHQQAEALREMAAEFMKQVEEYIAREEPIETVYRLNLQLFSLVNDTKSVQHNKSKSGK